MKLQPMTKPQRDNRIIALTDLIRTHRIHVAKLDIEIVELSIRLGARKDTQEIRRENLAGLVEEKKLLEEEAAK